MKLVSSTNDENRNFLEFELKPCKVYTDRRHINQTCHNLFEHCWKMARTERQVENAIAECLKLYPMFEPKIFGKSFEPFND